MTYLVNGKTATGAKIDSLLPKKGSYVVCEYITQGDFPASLYPHSVNTMRIICAKAKGEHRAKVVCAVQRIGRECTIPVDNGSKGGISCAIDIETGTLGPGMYFKGDKRGRYKPLDAHPDSGAQLTGLVIPNWAEVKAEVEAVTNRLPYLNFVAWDIVLTDTGLCALEGNASSGVGILQSFKGLRHSRLADIWRSYGVLK